MLTLLADFLYSFLEDVSLFWDLFVCLIFVMIPIEVFAPVSPDCINLFSDKGSTFMAVLL